MILKEFQLQAVKSLFEAMDKPTRDIVLKSPTGSGKTIILTYFMHQYIQSFPKTVFVWLTPGKGDLEEQSKTKMDKYIHNASTKLLSDVMTNGFEYVANLSLEEKRLYIVFALLDCSIPKVAKLFKVDVKTIKTRIDEILTKIKKDD